jgi:hypothetical protein
MSQLPDEYQEIEYIKFVPSKTYCLGGFVTEDEAKSRIIDLLE